MFLTVHAPAGALLGVLFGNPFLAFIFGLVSHFILDAIPHGDREVGEWLEKKKYKKYFAVVAADFFLLGLELAVLYWWFNHEKITSPFPLLEKERVMLVGIIGAILPDFTFPAWWVSRWLNGKRGLVTQADPNPSLPPLSRGGWMGGLERLFGACVSFHNRLHKMLYPREVLTWWQGLLVQAGFWLLLVVGLYFTF